MRMNNTSLHDAPFPGECVIISGPPASGKTETLVAHVDALLKSGIPASSIAVFAANPRAAAQLDERIFARTKNEEMRGQTRVPWQICLEIIEHANSGGGQRPHVLAKDEFDLLMEDMEEVEGDFKRNREIVKFLLRELTELGDDKEGMVFSEEERKLRKALEERCADRNAILRHQIAPKAVRCLKDDPSLAKRFSFPYVIVDDYPNLSRASQILLDNVHSEQITVTGCPALLLETYEPYPYERGMEELASRHADSEVIRISLEGCHLSKGINKIASSFAGDSESLAEDFPRKKADTARSGKGSIKQFLSIQDEIDDVVESVLDAPADERKKTAIIVPNDKWGARALAGFAARGVPAHLWRNDAPLASKADRIDARPAVDLLGLAADKENPCAWRSYLSHSKGFLSLGLWKEILEFARNGNVGPGHAIVLIAGSENGHRLPHGAEIASLARKALDAAASISEEKGEGIAKAAAKASGCDETFLSAAWQASQNDTCESLYGRIRREILFPTASSKDAVSIGTANALSGTSWKNAFVLGALEKMYPSAQAVKADETIDHKRLYMARDEKTFYAALTRATDNLRISFPTREPLEDAEKMSLGIRRIYSTENGRVALLAPSRFLGLGEKKDGGRSRKENGND